MQPFGQGEAQSQSQSSCGVAPIVVAESSPLSVRLLKSTPFVRAPLRRRLAGLKPDDARWFIRVE
jgi:hypothetical protein